MSDSDPMITPAHRRNTASPDATPQNSSPADLHPSYHHVNTNRRAQSPARNMIYTSSSSALERDFAVAGAWSPRCYACTFCGRDFNSAQALGGHMNIHRRDRARLRTSPSLPSLPYQVDLPPAPQNTPQSGHSTALYLPFQPPCTDNPPSISSTLNTYQPPIIFSPAPTYKRLAMRSAADPALRAMAASPHHDENSAASFSGPISDLVSFHCGSTRSSSATSSSKIQNGAHSLFPNIAPHASSLLIRPMNVCGGQASTQQFRLDCSGEKDAEGYLTAPQSIQAKGRNKRARGSELDAVKISSEDKSTLQSGNERPSPSVSSTENSNSVQTAAAPRSCLRPIHDSLDLELRLGQSSPAP